MTQHNAYLHSILSACCGAALTCAAVAVQYGHGWLTASAWACIAGVLYIGVWALEVDAEDEQEAREC